MTLRIKANKVAAFLWVVAVAVSIIDAVIYFNVTRPGDIKLAGLEQEYLARRSEQKSSREDAGGKDSGLNRIYAGIPKWEEFTKTLGEIYRKAEGLNLAVDSASYQTAEIKGTDLVGVKVSMPVAGSYGEIKRFIYELETSPALFTIEGISLSKDNRADKEISLMLELKIHFKG